MEAQLEPLQNEAKSGVGKTLVSVGPKRFRFLNADIARERHGNKRFSSRYRSQFLPRI
jgi:hypothetical protein